jgi:hypothetical protein
MEQIVETRSPIQICKALRFLVIITAIVSLACNRTQTQTETINYCPTISANPNDTAGFKLSKFSKNKDFTFLETCDSGLISRIQKLIQVKGNYYLMTSTNRGQLFIFRANGKFVNKFGRIGKGPGEYSELFDFSVDLSNNHVYLLSSTKKIIHLDDKLKWIEDIQLKKVPCAFDLHRLAVFRDNLFFRTYSQQNFSLLITDKKGYFKKFYFHVPSSSVKSFRNFIVTTDTLWYYRELCDTIYSFAGNSLNPKPYLKINFGKYDFVMSSRYNYKDYVSGKSEAMPVSKSISTEIGDVIFTKTSGICYYSLKHQDNYSGNFLLLFDKTNSICTPTSKFNDDFNSPLLFPTFISEDQTSFISVFYPYIIFDKKEELIKSLGLEKFQKKYKILDSISNLIQYDSNPFLFKFKLLIQ